MELGSEGQTASKKVDGSGWGSLVKLEEPLDVRLIMLVKQLLLLGREDQAGQAGEEDRHAVHLLNFKACRWRCTMSSGQASMKESKDSFSVCREPICNVCEVALNGPSDTNVGSLSAWHDCHVVDHDGVAGQLSFSLSGCTCCAESEKLGLGAYQSNLILLTVEL